MTRIQDEWELIFQVVNRQTVKGEIEYQSLVQSIFVFEYCDTEGTWFNVNPVLGETQKFKSKFQ